MRAYEQLKRSLLKRPKTWAITGVAGFIGSNLLEQLLLLDQRVLGLDNFETGHRSNLQDVERSVGAGAWKNFTFFEGSTTDVDSCARLCQGADFVLHQAALGSVPRSIANPVATDRANVGGFVQMLTAAKDAAVKRFVFASSSSVYGDHPALPKREEHIGKCLSPYATSKLANELYADVFGRCYGLRYVGLRYFNVFGPRQDPNGAYAAVIPKWIAALIDGEKVDINGDGETSRDFCFVANVVEANLLAATCENSAAFNTVYNVGLGQQTTLNQLFAEIRTRLADTFPQVVSAVPVHKDFRAGDVTHSAADVSKARTLLGYDPAHYFKDGLRQTVSWFSGRAASRPALKSMHEVLQQTS
jgi:UDP-N-acetylglucosamine 4-epimerase